MSTTPVLHQPAAEGLSESQWANLERTAERLAKVSWIPETYRGKPHEIMAAGLALATIGRDLSPMTLKLVYVVKGTVDFMVDLITAQVHEHGHEMWVVEVDETHATVAGQRRGSRRVHERTFTIEDAQKAGLVGKDVWKGYVKDMLVARAAKRVAKRICPEALLAMPPPLNYVVTEAGRVQLADIAHEHDPYDDITDAEIVGEGPPSHMDEETGEVPADDEQPEVYLKRQRWANAVMGEVGVTRDEARHELVRSATGGATQSTGRLKDWQVRAVVDFCDRLKAAQQVSEGGGQDEDTRPVPSYEPPSGQSAAASGPVPGEWRARATELGISGGRLLKQAREFAAARALPLPASLAEITDEQLVEDLREWIG